MRLSPVVRLGIEKICSAAQMVMGELAILRHENCLLWHCLQQKDSHKTQRSFIVSRARVVTEKDIMDARHAKNNVRVLAIKWPQPLPQESSTDSTTCPPTPVAATISTSEIPSNFMTSDDWENALFPVEDGVFDNLVQELPSLL